MPSSPLPAWLTARATPLDPKKKAPAPLVTGLAAPVSPELVAWSALVATRALPGERHFRVARPAAPTLAGVLGDPHALFTLLVGAVPVAAEHGGHVHWIASPHPTADGGAPVFVYDDEDDASLELRAPSLAHLVFETWQNEEGDPAVTAALEGAEVGPWDELPERPEVHDPPALFARARWITTALEADLWNDLELDELLGEAPAAPLAPFDQVRAGAPFHVAAHALLTAWLLAHDAALPGLAARLADHAHPFVREAAAALAALVAKAPLPPFVPKKLATQLTAARKRALAAAPPERTGAPPKKGAKAAPKKTARPKPLDVARAWIDAPEGDPPYALQDALEGSGAAVDAFVIEALGKTTHPEVVEKLAAEAQDRELDEAVPHLRRLIEGRVGFSDPARGDEAPAAAPKLVEALAVLEGKGALPFLRETLAASQARFAKPALAAHAHHHAAALLPGMLHLAPADAATVAAARAELEHLASAVENGVLVRPVSTTDLLAFLWVLEAKKLAPLRAILRPLADFEIADSLAEHPETERLPYASAQVADLLG